MIREVRIHSLGRKGSTSDRLRAERIAEDSVKHTKGEALYQFKRHRQKLDQRITREKELKGERCQDSIMTE